MSKQFYRKKILVTGAGGFIGANLIAALESDGAKVFSLVRKQTDLYRLKQIKSDSELLFVDLLEHDEVTKVGNFIQPDYVFHTATLRHEDDWQATLNINAAAIVNLIKAVASPQLKMFVHLGSSYEYGNIATPYKENDSIKPNTFFGASKAAGTLLLQHLAKCEGLPIIILRLFHVYGRMEPSTRLIPSAIKLILQNKDVPITMPSFVRDYIHIYDIIDACYKAAQYKELSGQIFNIGTGIETSSDKIVNDLGALMGKSVKIMPGKFPTRSWERTNWCADISLARKKLGWVPNTTLQEGLKQSIALYASSTEVIDQPTPLHFQTGSAARRRF